MKSILSGICVAFSLYSAIPAPQIAWEKNTMRYALACLPFIGLLVGGLEYGWYILCGYLNFSAILYATIAAILPILITGGIHLDGYVDTCDALSSHADREKKLEILKDPHVGAFGPLWLLVILLVQVGCYGQIYQNAGTQAPQLALVLLTAGVLGRTVGARCVVALPCAKNSGLAYLFAENAEKKLVASILLVQTIAILAISAWISPTYAAMLAICLLLLHKAHKHLCMRTFGGVTGDLSGFLNVLTETLVLALLAVGGAIL